MMLTIKIPIFPAKEQLFQLICYHELKAIQNPFQLDVAFTAVTLRKKCFFKKKKIKKKINKYGEIPTSTLYKFG